MRKSNFWPHKNEWVVITLLAKVEQCLYSIHYENETRLIQLYELSSCLGLASKITTVEFTKTDQLSFHSMI